jgi:hypothetical protein
MASATSSERDQTAPGEQDYVFNDETCRALRQQGHDAVRVLVPVFTFLLFCFAAVLQGVLTILGPWMEVVVGMVLSLIFAVTVIAEFRWFGVSFYREAVREMKRDLTREADVIAGDSEAIEAQVLEDASDPNARPELAFGLPPEDCVIISVVLMAGLLFALSASDAITIVLSLAGSIGLSGVLFAFSPNMSNRTPIHRRTHHEHH